MWVYRRIEGFEVCWQVGHIAQEGNFEVLSTWDTEDEARAETHYLNGGGLHDWCKPISSENKVIHEFGGKALRKHNE